MAMKVYKSKRAQRISQQQQKETSYSTTHRTCRRGSKRARSAQKRKMREAQALPSYPYMMIEFLLHTPQEVSTITYFDRERTSYARCPTCGYGMEREYQNHCERCGQLLKWNKYARNDVDVIRINAWGEKALETN